jgi:hypothetical protein
MPQQKGMKRAAKVVSRARKKKASEAKASVRRVVRAEELAEKEAQAQKGKK